MKLLMISGDRSILQGKKGAFWYTLEELAKYWERIDVICPRPDGMENARLPDGQGKWKMENAVPFTNVFFHPSSRGLWYQPWWILMKGDELLQGHRHDVMTVHEYPPFYNGLGARWLHRARGIPYMTEIHHIVGHPNAASVQEWIGYWMSRVWLPRWGTSQAAGVRVVNDGVRSVLCDWRIPDGKLYDVPSLYLDHALLVPDPSITKTYDVVFCARLAANKGLPELLHAIAALPDVTLLVIGDGSERSRCGRLAASLGIADRVKFAGWLAENKDVYRAIQSAKVFVMNSRSEGGPRVLFEAMALEMPVIATNVGLVSRVIKANVLNGVITTGTRSDVKEKIGSLLSNEQQRKVLGINARQSTAVFDRVSLVKNYADSLKKIASVHTS